MGGAIYKDVPAIKYEERNIYLNSIQTLGRYLTPSDPPYILSLPPPHPPHPPPPPLLTHKHGSLLDRRYWVICSRFSGE